MENRHAVVRRQIANPAWSARIADKALTAAVALGLGTVLLGGATLWREFSPRPRDIVASDGAGALVPLVPLNQPLVDRTALLAWAQECALRTYDLDYVHYRRQQMEAQRCFEVDAWNSWAAAFRPNMAAILENELHARLESVPGCPIRLVDEGLLGGRYGWKVLYHLKVTWTNTREARERTYRIEMLVNRTADPAFGRGIALRQFVASDWNGRC